MPPRDGHEQPEPMRTEKRLVVSIGTAGKGLRRGFTTVRHVDATLDVDAEGPISVEESLLRNSTVRGNGAPILLNDVSFEGASVVKNTQNGGISLATSDADPLHVVATSVSGSVGVDVSSIINILSPKPGAPVTDSLVADIGSTNEHQSEVALSTAAGNIFVAIGKAA